MKLIDAAALAASSSVPRSYVYIFTDSDTTIDGFIPLFNAVMEFPITVS